MTNSISHLDNICPSLYVCCFGGSQQRKSERGNGKENKKAREKR
jgi:hypothetical protein